jgi:hypothetical protein
VIDVAAAILDALLVYRVSVRAGGKLLLPIGPVICYQ